MLNITSVQNVLRGTSAPAGQQSRVATKHQMFMSGVGSWILFIFTFCSSKCASLIFDVRFIVLMKVSVSIAWWKGRGCYQAQWWCSWGRQWKCCRYEAVWLLARAEWWGAHRSGADKPREKRMSSYSNQTFWNTRWFTIGYFHSNGWKFVIHESSLIKIQIRLKDRIWIPSF